MIRELIRQIISHIKWFFNYPLSVIEVTKSFFCYLWKGYSHQDLWDVDFYLMKVFNNIIEDFTKDAEKIGYPADLTQDEWITLLKKSKELSDIILADSYENEEELLKLEEARQQWLGFIYIHFFDLWT